MRLRFTALPRADINVAWTRRMRAGLSGCGGVSWLRTASPMQMDRLARSKHAIFASRIPDGEVGERVLLSMETDESALLGRLHALQLTLTEDDDDNL